MSNFTLTDTFVKGQVKGACSFSDLQDRATPEGDLSGGSGEGQALFVLDSKALPPESEKLLAEGWGYLSPTPPPASLYPAIRTVLTKNDISDAKEGYFDLPGRGRVGQECGQNRGWTSCKCGSVPFVCSCKSLGCPVCFKSAIDREVRSAVERLVGVIKLFVVPLRYVRHVVISPPKGSFDYKSGKRVANRFLKKIGCLGGFKVFHPFRLKHKDGSDCSEKKICMREHREVPGPHWHILGWGFMEKADDVFRETGWVYKMIRPMESPGDVAVVLRYLLGHAGVSYNSNGEVEGSKSVSWFGLASSQKIGCEKTKVESVCVDCKEVKRLWVVNRPWIDGANGEDWSLEHIEEQGIDYVCLGEVMEIRKTYFLRKRRE